jgi:hypothetical protein
MKLKYVYTISIGELCSSLQSVIVIRPVVSILREKSPFFKNVLASASELCYFNTLVN